MWSAKSIQFAFEKYLPEVDELSKKGRDSIILLEKKSLSIESIKFVKIFLWTTESWKKQRMFMSLLLNLDGQI
jgi:hypothetical protein